MKRLLLATVAASVFAFMPLIATAQDTYATPAQTQAAPSATQSAMPDETSSSSAQAPGATSETTADPMTAPDETMAQTQSTDGAAAGSAMTQSADAQPGQLFAQNVALTDEDHMQLARDAGMSSVPMSAQQVCAQRTVTLADHGDTSRAQKVENAVDRASVCKVQSIVINAPRGEAARLQRAMIEHGVAEDMISMQTASSADANVQMTFAGIATSNEQYAQMFNQQYAANASAYRATASDANSGYAPSTAEPAAPNASTQPEASAPAMDAPSATMPDEAPDAAMAPPPTAPADTNMQ